ncbi:MAG: putative amidophosphoribosyltransferase [Kiritimatiellia bacterium]|jgi:predicted amidophosphoribosyltransferase
MLWTTSCGGCGVQGLGGLCARCRINAPIDLPVEVEFASAVWSINVYDSGLGNAVRRCKGGPDRGLGLLIAQHLALSVRAVPLDLSSVTMVTWAPSPWNRRARRGFNLAAMLAHGVSRRLRVPLVSTLSITSGRRQAQSSAAERGTNLKGRVRCARPLNGAVLLVDDVVTTGATIDACARELLGAGATGVVGITCCYVVAKENALVVGL